MKTAAQNWYKFLGHPGEPQGLWDYSLSCISSWYKVLPHNLLANTAFLGYFSSHLFCDSDPFSRWQKTWGLKMETQKSRVNQRNKKEW